MLVFWEGRGSDEAVQSLTRIVGVHQSSIESTTKGPIVQRSKCVNLSNVMIEEEQMVSGG